MPDPQTQPIPAAVPRPAAAPDAKQPGVNVPAAAPVCDEATKKAKEDFKNKGVYGPRNLSPPETGIGAFLAMYFPYASMLLVIISGKTKFINGLKLSGTTVSADEPKLAAFATLLNEIGDTALNSTIVPAYTWTNDQKNKSLESFKARIKETVDIWQKPGFSFAIKDVCWDDITAKPTIVISVENVGNAGLVSPGTNNVDNLQVKLVKVPNKDEMGGVIAKVIKALADKKKADKRWKASKEDVSTTPGSEVSATQNPSGAKDKGYSEMTLASSDLENTADEKKNKQSLLRRQVFFGKGQHYLQSEQREVLKKFHKDFKEGDKRPENSLVTMVGHASTSGRPEQNKILTEKRIESTSAYLKTLGFNKTASRIKTVNASTSEMEKEEESAANNPDPAGFTTLVQDEPYQRVDLIVGSGELQNTVAHEFGHVFGLRDEYVSKGTSFTGTGKAAGEEVGHSGMSEEIGAGKASAENNDNIMSMGNKVRAQHYATFGWALKQLTAKDWVIKS
jgi:outer membrane protein OmpA-like peptidoglycan-associated protein